LASPPDGPVEELLSPEIGGAFETFLTTCSAGASAVESVLRDTEEEGSVVNGRLDIWIGGYQFEVSTGDSFRIAREEIRWANRGDTDVFVVWVISPQLVDARWLRNA
jgi:quercetin dioxygenase-like cupin family protein